MKLLANVKWDNEFSETFSVVNGVRQGGVSSAILYWFYCSILFQILRDIGYGCWINITYHGISGYSDDNMLIAPSIYALQQMLVICETFAAERNLSFSTDVNPAKCNTKCTVFSRAKPVVSDVKLCGNNLPWVDKFKHLGNTISNDIVLTSQDVCVKRAQFITKTIEICQEFSFASSRTKCDINQIYHSHFTGSPLWDLFGTETHSLESSYNLAIKNMYDLPISTHRHLIGPISNRRHLRITLISRFLSFIEQLRNTDKVVSRMLFYHI